jgi:hypothetical protein
VVADAEVIARMVLACPAVDDLDADTPGSPTTYLPGRRVVGVSVAAAVIWVQVRMRWGTTVDVLNQQVRTALAPFTEGRRIEIMVSDITVPGRSDGPAGISPAPA